MTAKQEKNEKQGLPREAFAIVGDPKDPASWRLAHHRKSIAMALSGELDIEKTVDWRRMAAAAAALSPRRRRTGGIDAAPEQVLAAAGHLASHYQKAGKPLPDILAALA